LDGPVDPFGMPKERCVGPSGCLPIGVKGSVVGNAPSRDLVKCDWNPLSVVGDSVVRGCGSWRWRINSAIFASSPEHDRGLSVR